MVLWWHSPGGPCRFDFPDDLSDRYFGCPAVLPRDAGLLAVLALSYAAMEGFRVVQLDAMRDGGFAFQVVDMLGAS